MPSTARSLWRGLKLGGSGKVKLSAGAVDATKTVEGDTFLSGLPRTADGSIAVELPVDIPTPPGSGTKFLKSVNGTLTWSDS